VSTIGTADGSIIAAIITDHINAMSAAWVGDQAGVIGIDRTDAMSPILVATNAR
jgi:hypothetical protein